MVASFGGGGRPHDTAKHCPRHGPVTPPAAGQHCQHFSTHTHRDREIVIVLLLVRIFFIIFLFHCKSFACLFLNTFFNILSPTIRIGLFTQLYPMGVCYIRYIYIYISVYTLQDYSIIFIILCSVFHCRNLRFISGNSCLCHIEPLDPTPPPPTAIHKTFAH